MYTLNDLLVRIDSEIKQNKTNTSIVEVKDEGRIAKKIQVINWVNSCLEELSNINSSFWYRIIDITCQTESKSLELPNSFKRIYAIYVNEVKYMVGTLADFKFDYYVKDDRKIYRRNGSFTKGEQLLIECELRPEKIVFTESSDDDLLTPIDIDDTFFELVVYGTLLRYTGMQNTEMPLWWGMYKSQLAVFKTAQPKVAVTGMFRNSINFGYLSKNSSWYITGI